MPYQDIENLPIDDLLLLLRHNEIEMQWRAARALGRYGQEAVEKLLMRLYDDDHNVRMLSIWTLGRIGDERAIVPLSRVLHEEDFLIQMACEGALSRLNRQ
jgi:HEAT repeat protein